MMNNQTGIQTRERSAYEAIRSGIGVIELSSAGKIVVKGDEHVEFLDGLVTKDIQFMEEEKTAYALLLREDGTVIDLVNLFKNEDSITIITASDKKEQVLAWLQENREKQENQVEIEDISESHSLIGFEGPYAWKLAQQFLHFEISSLPFQSFAPTTFQGTEIILARTGVTGEYGYQLLFERELRDAVLEMMNSFEEIALQDVDKEALETAMLEIRHPYFEFKQGQELSLFEVCLEWFVDFYKDAFIGKEFLEQQLEKGISQRIVGFTTDSENPVSLDDEIYVGEHAIGKVIEFKESPGLHAKLGIGLLREPFAVSGIHFQIKDKQNRIFEATTQSSPYILCKSWEMKTI
ncbi:aminomethyl transferase family protein [Paenibacillus melissococcoides]|uniref:Aminomethyl transferase family protein n=1 Tax=Paenibacillus melissococcoides TaxID=2912268 RepID=A0ABM9G8M6_9BACL|nr:MULTISPECIES: aminomethyl transferase family protein [Paenibacillus]MEB9892485.1 aminomethyl transferase family protein [Bacillus cereus]CAH8248285.1 aminomethyl transferase family protein [Paenibacillus melissococcoides]CAH8717939.1 aminomethyl transferase family protein [Paenibacillus melissococcoides]CAH8719183.1 aminomethyl transferase family protein [Paenibacillus melissococcoides]GIO78635.1 hypothetical protein J6TS7_22450 [Paenibacillus dendritiformis]